MSDASVPPLEIPGRPMAYYLQVLRRRWVYLVAGLMVGVLLGVGFLLAWPRSVTASAVVELAIITSDPFGLDRAPSSLLDVGTEQQVARSYLVAEGAAERLGGELTPAQVRAGSEATVGSQGTVVTIRFTASREELARAGADALAQSYLEARGAQVEGRITDQLNALEERLLELETEQADLLEAADSADGANPLVESRDQLIRNEIQALVQQRTNLNSVSTSGGRILTSAQAGEVAYAPSRSTVIAAAAMAGLLGGLVLAFARQRFSHRVADVAEVESATGAAVLLPGSAGPRWTLPGAIMVGMLPAGESSLVLVSLATAEDINEIASALQRASDRDPASQVTVSTIDGWFAGREASFAELRGAEAAAIVVNRRMTSTKKLEEIMAILGMLQVPVVASFWCSGRDHRSRRAQRRAPRAA